MAYAVSWQESLSSAASELTKESGSTQAGCQPSSSPACWAIAPRVWSAGTMNNAAGIPEYCAKQKLASVTDAQMKLCARQAGSDTCEQKADTNYMDGIQGLLERKMVSS